MSWLVKAAKRQSCWTELVAVTDENETAPQPRAGKPVPGLRGSFICGLEMKSTGCGWIVVSASGPLNRVRTACPLLGISGFAGKTRVRS